MTDDGPRRWNAISRPTLVLAVLFLCLTLPSGGTTGHRPTLVPLTAALNDNFTQDTQLNTNLWQVNGSASLGAAEQIYRGTVIAPALTFSRAAGLEMTGVNQSYELTGVQSVASFSPPFVASATVKGTVSHGAAFLVVLTNLAATSWLEIDGYVNSQEGSSYGIGLDVLAAGSSRWSYLGNLVDSPSLGTWYEISVGLSVGGTATARVASGGTSLGTQQVALGQGPFVLALMQAENSMPIAGANVADWANASVAQESTPALFGVTFAESGLPSGLNWSVSFNGVSAQLTTNGATDTLTFASEANGSYVYAITDLSGWHERTMPYRGSETVNGAPLSVSVSYLPVAYRVSFVERGLPAGMSWSVALNGVVQGSSTDNLTFDEANGSSVYHVESVAGFTVFPSTGTANVTGSPETINLTFSPTTGSAASTGLFGVPGGAGYYLLGGSVAAAAAVAAATIVRYRRRKMRRATAGARDAGEAGEAPQEFNALTGLGALTPPRFTP